MPVFVFGFLMVSGLVLFVVSDAASATVEAVLVGVEHGEVADGGVSGRFDAAVERSHPLRTVALPVVAAVRYIALRQGNAGVVVGLDGWLFTDEEFQHHPEDEARLTERLEYVREVASGLERRHSAELVVVIVPSKARVAAEYVPSYIEPAVFHDRLGRAVGELRGAGITVANATDNLEAEDFFRRDTHWTPAGAERVAQLVSNASEESGGFGTDYRLRQLESETLEGDLLSFVPAGPWRDPLGLTVERYRPLEADRVGGAASGGGGLFDTPRIPIALVGTSYSADQRFGFEAALRAALGGAILNVAEPAGGPFRPMEAYLQGDTISEIQPKMVIWEIPERYLTLPRP